MNIYCCNCKHDVDALLTDGTEIYPHRKDLADLPFWKCRICENFVGCHHKTHDRTRPLGCIPTKEVKAARQTIHALLDPIWKNKWMERAQVYSVISNKIGRTYHTAEIRSMSEANIVIGICHEITQKFTP